MGLQPWGARGPADSHLLGPLQPHVTLLVCTMFHRLFYNSTVILAAKKIGANTGRKAMLEEILRGFLMVHFALYIDLASISLDESPATICL